MWWVEKKVQLLVLWAAPLVCFFSEKEVKVILVTYSGFLTSRKVIKSGQSQDK